MTSGAREKIKAELTKLVDQTGDLSKAMEKGPLDFSAAYQDWYTKAIRIVHTLAPDRFPEFTRYYEPDPKRKSYTADQYRIQDYVNGLTPTRVSTSQG